MTDRFVHPDKVLSVYLILAKPWFHQKPDVGTGNMFNRFSCLSAELEVDL